MSLLVALNGHDAMSALSPLSVVERKSNFGAVRSVHDPERTFSSREGVREKWASQARTHCLRGQRFRCLDQLQATASAVVGSITERTLAMLLAGKPPFCAC